jgi:hypothetical protein
LLFFRVFFEKKFNGKLCFAPSSFSWMILVKMTWRHTEVFKEAQIRARNMRIRNFWRAALSVISTLVVNISFNKILQWLKVAWLWHIKIGKSTFYRRQKEIGKKIIQLCDKKMIEESEKIDSNTIIGVIR